MAEEKAAKHALKEAEAESHAMGAGTPVAQDARKLSVRGAIFVGKVRSARAPLTVKVEKKIVKYVPKYERYKKDRAMVKAHNPEAIGAKEGDLVKVGETRKISKTKSFVVLEILKRGKQNEGH